MVSSSVGTVSPARDTPINAPCGAVEHCDPTHACPSNANSVESQQDTDTHCTQSAPRCSTPRSSEKKPSSRRRERRFATVTPPELSTLMQSTNVDNRIGPALPHTSVIASAVKTSKIIRASMPLISESLAYQANERRPMSSVTASSLPSGFLTASRQSNCTPPVIDTQSHIRSNSFSDPTQVSNRPHTSATPVCSVAKTHSTLKGLPWLSPKSIQLLANQSSVLTNSSGVSREASTSTLLPLSRSLPPKDNELLAPLSSQKPVSPPKPGRRKRCSLCLRKTGLVGGYSCRCGRNFCFRHRFEELLLFNELQRSNTKALNQPITIQEPCLSKDKEQNATLVPRNATDVSPASPAELTYQVKFVGTGDYDTCRQTMYPILDKQTDCQPFQCAIGHTPQADIDFPVVVFYGLTNFYYSMEDFLPSSNYSYAIASKGVKEACAKTWEKFVEDFTKSHPELTQEQLQRAISLREYVCFKGVYTITLLHDGFNFPRDYQNLLVVDTLNNTDVQWSLGALFYILNFVPMDNPGGLLGYQIALILLAVILAIGISVIVTVMCVCKKRRADKASPSEPSTIEDTLANTQPDGISQPKPNL
ncbi:unnamed protein product [Dicrocoelium dendriticum]|nr:unnamed protein product [Dicrocoelium dendriticum]